MRYASLALAAVVLLPATAAAQRQAPPPAATPKPFNVPQPREFALANGLEVTLIPYGTIPKAQVSLVLRTGNIDEAANEVWLADLTRDLMLEGTTTRSAADIAREAASYGGAVTMNVGADETAIGGEVLSDFVDEMIGLVADVARNPAFPESELARLKTNRVRQLSIARSQPQALAQEKFAAVIHPNHPYGRSFPTERMIQGYTIDQIRQFYAENFGAVRAHLYVAGVFDAAAVERAARAALGDWAAGTAAAPTPPSPTSARTVHLIDRPGAPQSTIFLGLPVIDPSHADYVPLLVTNALLGGAFGSRITSNIREQKGYTYSPNSLVSVRYRDAVWAEVADVTTNVTGASLKEIFYEIDRLQAEPPPAEELRGIQNYYAGLFVLQNSSRPGLIAQLRFLELHGLPREYLTGFVQRVYAVTPADVQRIAQQYLKDENMTIVVVGDRAQITEQLKPYGEIMN
jgi:predicted Zn-dependent peptidase